jgi:hypothetical protein
MANVVIQAIDEQEIKELDSLCEDVRETNYIKDYNQFVSDAVKIAKNRGLAASYFDTGYEIVTPVLSKAKQKGAYFFRQYLCDTPAVLAMLDELYLMMTLKDSYPGTRETANHRIITLLKALDLFWD